MFFYKYGGSGGAIMFVLTSIINCTLLRASIVYSKNLSNTIFNGHLCILMYWINSKTFCFVYGVLTDPLCKSYTLISYYTTTLLFATIFTSTLNVLLILFTSALAQHRGHVFFKIKLSARVVNCATNSNNMPRQLTSGCVDVVPHIL